MPERSRGDILRMQSLHDADVQPGDVTTASEYGAQLLGYIFERKRSAPHHGVVA